MYTSLLLLHVASIGLIQVGVPSQNNTMRTVSWSK